MTKTSTTRLGSKNQAVYDILLSYSKIKLSETERSGLELVLAKVNNYDFFVERALASHLGPLLYKTLSSVNHNLPTSVTSTFANAYNQVLVRNIRMYESFTTILEQLNEAGIDCVPLKGIYLAETVYNDLGLRHLSDIDILIRSEDVELVCKLMQKTGWNTKKAVPHSALENEMFTPAHPYTFYKNGVTVELHTHLYNRHQGAKISEAALWELTHKQEFCGGIIRQFGHEMLLQHLCLHLHKHLEGYELKVVSFCDIRELIVKQRESIDWNYFEAACTQFRCLSQVQETLRLCVKHWKVEIPDTFFKTHVPNHNTEARFLDYLSGYSVKPSMKLENIASIKWGRFSQLKGFTPRLKFIVTYLFPRPAFMYGYFNLNEGSWLFPWYVLRVLILAHKSLIALASKIRNQFR
ncbi:MAG: nucleotidyltransferase family protein [Flavobacteriales bacterium]|nr:nucleotidyltransferase family protein [Flavobacteriales bacterium]